MLNKNYLAIFIAVVAFSILGVAVYYAFQYPRPVIQLGAPSANLTRDVAPIFNSTSTDSDYGNYSLGSSTANYFGLFARYGSTTAISISTGLATTTLTAGATSTFATGIQLSGLANICLSGGTCLTAAGSGITTLNTLTGATQTFTAQGELTIASAGTEHVFNASTSPGVGFITASSTTRTSEFRGLLTLAGGLNASSTATSTFAGGISVAAIGGLSSASGLTITGGSIKCTTCIPNASLLTSTISGISLGGTLGALTATDGTLTFSGSYDGSTARTVGIALGNTNAWTTTSTTTFAGGLSVATSGFLSTMGLTLTGGSFLDTSAATSTFANGLIVGLTNNGLTIGTTTLLGKATIDGSIYLTEQRVACTGAVTIDWSIRNKAACQITGNITSVTFTGIKASGAGTSVSWVACQDSVGGRSLAGWGGNIFFGFVDPTFSTTTPGISTAPGTCNTFTFQTSTASTSLIYLGTLPLKTR